MKNLFFLVLLSFSLQSFAASNPQSIVHLLTYLSQDYSGAVKDGKVVSEEEYHEQLELIDEIIKYADRENPFPLEIKKSINYLKKLIEEKSEPIMVSKIALDIKTQVINTFKIPTFPNSWPSPGNGEKIYLKNCASCHGDLGYGDGPESKGLNPMPRNFHDKESMEKISTFQAFNTVVLGIEGTSMVPVKDLSEAEAWDVAFYVISLRYQNSRKEQNNDFELTEVSSKSDFELKEKLTDFNDEAKNSRIADRKSVV